jgi:hypothetical protein
LPAFLGRVLEILYRKDTTVEPIVTPRIYLHALEVVLDCLYYNPVLTFHHLEALSLAPGNTHGDLVAGTLTKWFRELEKLSRVHDRKLGIMAVVALLENIAALPMLAVHVPALVNAALVLFAGLPKAIKGASAASRSSHINLKCRTERAEAETSALESDDEDDGPDLDDLEVPGSGGGALSRWLSFDRGDTIVAQAERMTTSSTMRRLTTCAATLHDMVGVADSIRRVSFTNSCGIG